MSFSDDFSVIVNICNLFYANIQYLLGFAVLGLAASGCGCGCGKNHNSDCSNSGDSEEDEEDSIYQEMEKQIEKLKADLNAGKTEVTRDLADSCLAMAVQLQQDGYPEEAV
ncbi:MAG: hypothetical protein ACRC2T_11820, partial [Thermoguttaceae bacterium]